MWPCLCFLSVHFRRMRWSWRENTGSAGTSPSLHYGLGSQERMIKLSFQIQKDIPFYASISTFTNGGHHYNWGDIQRRYCVCANCGIHTKMAAVNNLSWGGVAVGERSSHIRRDLHLKSLLMTLMFSILSGKTSSKHPVRCIGFSFHWHHCYWIKRSFKNMFL